MITASPTTVAPRDSSNRFNSSSNSVTVLANTFWNQNNLFLDVGDVNSGGATGNLQLQTGLSASSTFGGATISVGTLTLGGDQAWANNGTNSITVNSVVTGFNLTLGGAATGSTMFNGTGTFVGGLCFLGASILLLPERTAARATPAVPYSP